MDPSCHNRYVCTQVDDRLGGAPANVACQLARLGTAVAFLGRLGEDGIGERVQKDVYMHDCMIVAAIGCSSNPSPIVFIR